MRLVVGDVGGQFDALMKLVEGATEIYLVGDLPDRGPKSREVIEWAMTDPRVKAHKGNHEDMMVDFYDGLKSGFYSPGDWLRNGGYQTMISYGMPVPKESTLDIRETVKLARQLIPGDHIEWVRSLPIFTRIQNDREDVLISHAPMPHPRYLTDDLEEHQGFDGPLWFKWIWNRGVPTKIDSLQIFGHNSGWGLRYHDDQNWICLDDSRYGKLTALDLDSGEIKQVVFDEEAAGERQGLQKEKPLEEKA